jgi:hypothetical protein
MAAAIKNRAAVAVKWLATHASLGEAGQPMLASFLGSRATYGHGATYDGATSR